jgi:hypothetical protein
MINALFQNNIYIYIYIWTKCLVPFCGEKYAVCWLYCFCVPKARKKFPRGGTMYDHLGRKHAVSLMTFITGGRDDGCRITSCRGASVLSEYKSCKSVVAEARNPNQYVSLGCSDLWVMARQKYRQQYTLRKRKPKAFIALLHFLLQQDPGIKYRSLKSQSNSQAEGQQAFLDTI